MAPSLRPPSEAAPAAPSASVSRQVERELIALAYRLARIGIPAQVAAALIVCTVAKGGTLDTFLAFWLTGMVSLALLRAWVGWRFIASDEGRADPRFERWGTRFLALASATGIGWGLCAGVVYPATNDANDHLILAVISGVLALGPYSMAALPRSSMIYSTLVCTPLAFVALGSEARFEPPLAVAVVVFWGMLAAVTFRLHRTSREAFTLRYVNAELLGSASDANRRLALNNEALAASQDKFRMLTELSSDWYWEQDAEARLVSLVGNAARGGMPIADFAGKRLWDLPGCLLVESEWTEVQALLARREPIRELLMRVQAADGAARFMRLSGAPFFDAKRRFMGYRGVTRDVTAARAASDALARATAAAEAANRAKSEFLANMSHEIRTPMNGVIGTLDLLEGSTLGPIERRYVALASSSAIALVELIDDVLDFSKIEAGRLVLEQRPFELRRLVEDVVALFEPRARAAGLVLDLALDPRVPERIVGDSARLRQVLSNLVGNAIKFTASGGVTVRMLPEATADASGPGEVAAIRCLVEDTGIGIDPSLRSQLFRPFTQADGSTTRRYGGTGLGLAICRQLVDAMKGRIDFESKPGEGTTFWFILPVVVADAEPQAPAAKSVSPTKLRGRALLVEDNAVNRELALSMLGRLGLAADHAEDGRQGIARWGERDYDVVLMDCQMPEMDGFEAARRIRELEAARGGERTPIIALTANALAGDRERCIEAGMDDYLAKPMRLAELRSMLARWLPARDPAESTSTRAAT